MEPETKAHLTDRTIWMRLLYMVIFTIAYAVAEVLVALVAIFQFVVVLITGSANEALLRFGTNLSAYVYQILQFVTFNDERLPFPLSEWPDEEPGETPWSPSSAGYADPAEPASPHVNPAAETAAEESTARDSVSDATNGTEGADDESSPESTSSDTAQSAGQDEPEPASDADDKEDPPNRS